VLPENVSMPDAALRQISLWISGFYLSPVSRWPQQKTEVIPSNTCILLTDFQWPDGPDGASRSPKAAFIQQEQCSNVGFRPFHRSKCLTMR
jgi:hypothetical protein